MKYHPDRVPADERAAAEQRFKRINTAYQSALASAESTTFSHRPRETVNKSNINAVRDARYASRSSIWLNPAMLPLFASFVVLAGLTYHHVNLALNSTRWSRPYGILGPTVNEFFDDEDEENGARNRADTDKTRSRSRKPT
eukprot:TRINITY_DN15818_c0_g1_i2.p2 TRINITY_DN15818_c0_g1~~TRINITY_DN15818_c0_g1_i2.p2  ORF type:complete len:158 (+),score=12.06 TRINITY_DN15818_c0_g1_i2:53-475(+)